MIKLFSNLPTKKAILIATIFLSCIKPQSTSANTNTVDPGRAEEIKQMMWNSGDPDFAVTEIPEKWADESAVYIAKSDVLSYRKAPIVAMLNHDRFNHQRIKLLDKAAVEAYAQFTYPESGYLGGVKFDIYAGFKVIKPNGEEVEIPLSDAVKQELEVDRSGFDFYKLAIPNLEVGDIIDFYIAEERVINLASKYYSFDPVIFQLNDEYPVLKQKISFDVLRRCYINLKSLNGAPDFKLTEDYKGDKNQYSLEDGDRESTKNLRWHLPNRALPTIKFKVTYASAMAANMLPLFLGEAGHLKSEVSDEELKKFVKYVFNAYAYMGGDIKSHMKKQFKGEKDLNKIAREAFYFYRNKYKVAFAEPYVLSGKTEDSGINLQDVVALSNYYKSIDIPHQVIIGVPRHISTIDELILENELTYMLKVNTTNPFYIADCSSYAVPGTIDPSLQGTAVFAVDGNLSADNWKIFKTTVPVESHAVNTTESVNKVTITDIEAGKVEMQVSKSFTGANKPYYQSTFMDVYSYLEVEKERYEMEEEFKNYSRSYRKELTQKKTDYLENREKKFNDLLKELVETELDLKINIVSNLKTPKTGRYDDEPTFVYEYKVEAEDAVKKVGKNYLVEIGKFIDGQVQLTEEERTRDYDVYQTYARAFSYQINLKIPEGFEVQGIEALNINVENKTGAFISKAKVVDGHLLIDTYKQYSSNFIEKTEWPLMVEFLDAAYSFTQQKVLLKKMN